MNKKSILTFAIFLTTLTFAIVRLKTQQQLQPGRMEQRSCAYIKVHKTASETVASVLRRFGLERNLSFALPLPGKNNLGWPHPLTKDFFVLQPGVRHPNLLVEHSVYNRSFLNQLMRKPCVFVTSLRNPLYQVQSTFKFFGMAETLNLTHLKDPFTTFMMNVTKFDAEFKSRQSSFCFPIGTSRTKNFMSGVLGFREGVDNPRMFVNRVVSEFDLIIINERFLESMVLLKRLMNWSLKDILFEKQFVSHHRVLTPSTAPQVAAAHRRWSPVDYMLYDAAAVAFQRRVSAQDVTFKEEVEEYRRVLEDVTRHCQRSVTDAKMGKLIVKSKRSTQQFVVSLEDCRSIRDKHKEDMWQLSRQLYRGDMKHLPQYC